MEPVSVSLTPGQYLVSVEDDGTVQTFTLTERGVVIGDDRLVFPIVGDAVRSILRWSRKDRERAEANS